MTEIMRLENISLSLGGRAVLHGVSLGVRRGEVIALVGPNGAGKSSLLRVMAGLLRPNSGDVDVDGLSIFKTAPPILARQIAYLPQARNIHWPMPARAIVALGRLPHQASGESSAARDSAAVDAAMAQMDILAFAKRPVMALSGGEQARVLMARALAQEPRLLLADEPTAGLDIGHQLHLTGVLRERAAMGAASVVALHDLGLAARVADRVVLLSDGRIVAAGPPATVLTEGRIRDVYGVDMTVTTIDGLLVFLPRNVVIAHRPTHLPHPSHTPS